MENKEGNRKERKKKKNFCPVVKFNFNIFGCLL